MAPIPCNVHPDARREPNTATRSRADALLLGAQPASAVLSGSGRSRAPSVAPGPEAPAIRRAVTRDAVRAPVAWAGRRRRTGTSVAEGYAELEGALPRRVRLPSAPSWPQEASQLATRWWPAVGEDRLGVELHALDGKVPVAQSHDRAVLGPGSNLEASRHARLLYDERVVAGGHERVGQPGEDPLAVVAHLGGLAVHHRVANHPTAENVPDALVPEAHAENRDALVRAPGSSLR